MSSIPYSHTNYKAYRTSPHLGRSRQVDTSQPTGPLQEQFAQVYNRLQYISGLFRDKQLPLEPATESITVPSLAAAKAAQSDGGMDDHPDGTPSRVTVETEATARSSAESTADGDEVPPCVCNEVCTVAAPGSCGVCGSALIPVHQLLDQLTELRTTTEAAQERAADVDRQNELQRQDLSDFSGRIIRLEDELDQSRQEVATLRRDLRVLNDKFVDEVEKVAEIQHSKLLVEEELEDLSRKLFEQANTMVADEARQRHDTETTLAETRQELERIRTELAQAKTENHRLQERQAVDAVEAAGQATASASRGTQDHPSDAPDAATCLGLPDALRRTPSPPPPPPEIATDEQLLLEFQDFVFHCSSVKLFKIHTFGFMRNCLAEDVEPCLRFGPTPRISSKNLLDAILFDTLVLEPVRNGEPNPTVSSNGGTHPPATAAAVATVSGGGSSGPADSASPRPSSLAANLGAGTSAAAAATRFLSSKQALLWERFSGSVTANPHGCQACGRSGACGWRFQMGYYAENEEWSYIDQFCRDRLMAVCEFYRFVRHLYQGLFSHRSMQELYLESQRLRLRILYARLGAFSMYREHPQYLIRKLNAPSMSLTPRKVSTHAGGSIRSVDGQGGKPHGNGGAGSGGNSPATAAVAAPTPTTPTTASQTAFVVPGTVNGARPPPPRMATMTSTPGAAPPASALTTGPAAAVESGAMKEPPANVDTKMKVTQPELMVEEPTATNETPKKTEG
ncbi:hypothetical protein IWQ60_003482 [Tieghemiomyces parasiticus]|uniref:GDP/GTP exchange factor Sec2 N-terminal domain-containing protein n=1 Tax=Tieghemiomyces parasiticus TaxID=78921 RepID=A0A9W8E0N2_9FUNG|nr:hypothetical protein IWQ60_003482 [Tieghemiomyces parasiticus]